MDGFRVRYRDVNLREYHGVIIEQRPLTQIVTVQWNTPRHLVGREWLPNLEHDDDKEGGV